MKKTRAKEGMFYARIGVRLSTRMGRNDYENDKSIFLVLLNDQVRGFETLIPYPTHKNVA
jgi:hypothetical protein